MKWAQITLEATKLSSDAISEIFNNADTTESRGGCVIIPCEDKAIQKISAYLPIDKHLEEKLALIRTRLDALEEYGIKLYSKDIAVEYIDDENWLLEWRKFFKPMRIGKVIIKPSWKNFAPEADDIVVNIDPAMAFGTGSHPTTKLCVQLLQDIVKGGEEVLDVGTGSGILAMIAAKLGAKKVTAIDIELLAVKTAQKNIDSDGLSDKIKCFVADSPKAYDGKADIIVANIVAVIISEMAPQLADKLKPDGYLITSGIIDHMAQKVKESLAKTGLTVIGDHREGDWRAFVCAK